MIYITGDTHGDFSRFDESNFPIQKEMSKNDYVIICGDFGGVWSYERESFTELLNLNLLNFRNFTTLFVDGNHENFDRLYSYPVKEWHGGKVHVIRDSVFHLIRGEVYDIDGKTFFAFGGARSHDIQDGILNLNEEDKIYEYRKRGAIFRIRNYSWWDLELPTDEEMQNGIKNLEKHDYKVDYVITHCCPTSILPLVNIAFKSDYLADYLQTILDKCTFKKWWFGHYHENKRINPQYTLLYESIEPLEYRSEF